VRHHGLSGRCDDVAGRVITVGGGDDGVMTPVMTSVMTWQLAFDLSVC
jgi:hypothetical protein